MVNDARTPPQTLGWLVDWLRDASCHNQCHSLVLDATCPVDLNWVSASVANYLNEFDGDCDCAWRTFDCDLLQTLAADPFSRAIVLGPSPSDQDDAARPDMDRIIRRLASLGGVIFAGRCGVDATQDLLQTFHIYLCADAPPVHRNGHMWVSPDRFSPESLVTVIANSFLDWSCQASANFPTRRPGL